MDKDQFLNWEAASRDTIDVKRCYIHLAGDIVSGVLLSQIIYLFLPDRNGDEKPQLVERDGDLWVALKRTDWWDECCLSPKQFDRSCAELEDRRLVVVGVHEFRGEKRKGIRINWDEFLASLKRGYSWKRSESENDPRNGSESEGGKCKLPKGEFANGTQPAEGKSPKGQNANYPKVNKQSDDSAIPFLIETLKKTQEEESGVLTLNVSGRDNSVVSSEEKPGQEPEMPDPCEDDPDQEWGVPKSNKLQDIVALKVATELRDPGSLRRHRQLVGICYDNNLMPLIDQALRATRDRMADEKRLGALERPARYYDATIVRLLIAEGVHVPRRAEVKETMAEMRDLMGLPEDASPEEIREALRHSLASDDEHSLASDDDAGDPPSDN